MKNCLKFFFNSMQRNRLIRMNPSSEIRLPKQARIKWSVIKLVKCCRFSMGEMCIIQGTLQCEKEGASLELGERVFLGDRSTVVSTSEVKIGNDVLISHNCYITDTAGHSLDPEIRRKDIPNRWKGFKDWSVVPSDPIVIGRDVWIGPNVTILKGVAVGDAAIIAAGSVVTKDVEEYSLVAGVPARKVRSIDRK
jgi:galactoside O-acetyltransferase